MSAAVRHPTHGFEAAVDGSKRYACPLTSHFFLPCFGFRKNACVLPIQGSMQTVCLGITDRTVLTMRLVLPAQAAGRGMPAICFDILSRLPAHGSPGKRAVSSVRNSIHTKRPFWRNKFFEKAAYLLKGRIRVSKKPYLFYRPGREAELRPVWIHCHQKQPLTFLISYRSK